MNVNWVICVYWLFCISILSRFSAEIREAFRVLDRDGNGFISKQELGMAMRSLGYMPSEVELAIIMQRLDMDGESVSFYISLILRFHTNKRSVCLLIICETALQSVTDPFQSLHWTDIWYSEQFMLRSDHRIEQFIQHRGAVNTPVSEVNSENPASYCVCVSGFKGRQGQVTVDWTVWEHALI